MEICVSDIKTADLKYLKGLQSVEGDLEIARRVATNDKRAVSYFLEEFSIPFLDYIGEKIMKREGVYVNENLCYYPTVSAEYFEFIGAKFIDKMPEWHKLLLYKGIKNKGSKDARLYTYVNTITIRHFNSLRKKEERSKEKTGINMLENMNVCILKEYDGFDEIFLEDDFREETEFGWAWKQLPKRDQLILQYLVVEELRPLDIFDNMIPYINTGISLELYSNKQKQDAMSLLKGRAKDHLRQLIIEFRKKRKHETSY